MQIYMIIFSISLLFQYLIQITSSSSASFYYSDNSLQSPSQIDVCESLCLCLTVENAIVCNNNKEKPLTQLPAYIQNNIHKLIVQEASFTVPYIDRYNLTGLTNLTYLKIIRSGLIGIKSNSFIDMKYLKFLDLSYNSIKVIQPYTFNGLSLSELHLMKNRGIRLVKDSFKNCRVKSINLRRNDLTNIDYDTFEFTGVTNLYLYDNRISFLNEKFSRIFQRSESLIDLSGNPLSCTCEMKWIVPILKMKYHDFKLKDTLKGINFTCATPMKLSGQLLQDLSIHQLSCPSPKIKSIQVVFGIPTTQLTCIAIGNNFRAPGISWNYMADKQTLEHRITPSKGDNGNTKALLATLTVNVTTLPNKNRAFTCKTWLEDSQNEEIVVNIKAPDLKYPPIPTLSPALQDQIKKLLNNTVKNNNNKDNNNSNKEIDYRPTPEYHYVFKKQFTILEMIGAVFGTFTVTICLLMLIAQLLRHQKRKKYARHLNNHHLNIYHSNNSNNGMTNILGVGASTNTNSITKPYWTLGHDSNQTYSHPDVYDTSRAASICHSPPLNRMEFYDYKTQDRVYCP